MKRNVQNKQDKGFLLVVSMAITIAHVGNPTPAHAQMVLEEVVVTARKREESLQQTPVAISALNGTQLKEAGLQNLTDLTRVVPNLAAFSGTAGGFAQVFVRGVGARNAGVNFDGGVSTYQDGVYISRADGNILENIDVQSVQVLRGPQGTLFGKNSTGGAILYATNKPNETLSGRVELEAGNLGRLDGEATLNLPLTDTLFSRLSVFSTQREGLVKDQLGRELSDQDKQGAQLQFRWLANEHATIDINAIYGEVNQASVGQSCANATGVQGAGWQAALQNGIIQAATGANFSGLCARSEALGRDNVLSALVGPLVPKYESQVSGLSGTLGWDISDSLSFLSVTAWRNIEAGQQDDLFGIGVPALTRLNFGFPIAEPKNTDWVSQELQLTGSRGTLNYVLGVFAANEQTTRGTAVGQQGPFYISDNVVFYNAQGTEILTDNTSFAAFSQVEWSINDSWNLTLGLRYTWEQRELDLQRFDIDAATLSTATAVSGSGPIWILADGSQSFNSAHGHVPGLQRSGKVSNSDWTPMASIQYLFDGSGMVNSGSAYFTVASGFLSGGLSENLDLQGNLTEYQAEEVLNYEFGVKLDMFDKRVRLNAALFYTDYQDRQLTSVRINPQTGTIAGATINAAQSSIAGLEIETTWLATENFQLTFNAAFNNGEIQEFDDVFITLPGASGLPNCTELTAPGGTLDECPVDRSNEDLPNLPTQTYYLAGQYQWSNDGGEFTARLDASYVTDFNQCFDYASCLWMDGQGLVTDRYSLGARLSWYSADAHWQVSAYGRNLTDYRYQAGGVPLIGTTETTGRFYNEPRTYGLELAYSF